MLGLEDLRADLELQYQSDSDTRESKETGLKSTMENRSFRETLTLGLDGYVYHPRFLDFRGDLGLDLEQGWSVTDTPSGRREGSRSLFGPLYGISGTFLSDHPVSLSFGLTRRRLTITPAFAELSTVEQESQRLNLRLKRGPLPTQFFFAHSTTVQDQRGFGQDRDEEVTSWGFTTEHQAGPSSSQLSYEYRDSTEDVTDVRDVVTAFTTTRKAHDARFSNHLQLSESGSSYLGSRLWYRDETGTFPSTRFSLDESLHLQHTKRFATDYEVHYSRQEVAGSRTEILSERAGLSHQLYESLFTNLEVRGSQERFDGSSRDILGGSLSLNYRKRIRYGTLFVTLGTGYEIADEKGRMGTRTALDERHVLDDAQTVFLDNVNVRQITQVTTADASRRLLVRGTDYRVLPRGNRTEIRRIPSSPSIRDGDPVLVTYSYEVEAPLAYATRDTQAGIRLELFDQLSLYARRNARTQDLRSGTDEDNRLGDTTDTLYGARLRWGVATLTAEHQVADDFRSAYESDSISLDVRKPLSRDQTLTARTSMRRVTYEDEGKSSFRSISATYDFSRQHWPSVQVEVGNEWQDDRGFSDDFFYGRIEVSHRIRGVEITGSYRLNRRDDDFSRERSNSFFLSIRRSF